MIRAQPAPKGHNSKAKAGPVHADRLKSFIERVEKLIEERKAIQSDIKDVFSEAKGIGYDVRTMRSLIKLRDMDAADRAEAETLLDTYAHALGMVVGGNPLDVGTSEEQLLAQASKIVREVDACMALSRDGQPPKIEAIKDLIGCSAGKAHKLRTFVAERLSRSIAVDRENEKSGELHTPPEANTPEAVAVPESEECLSGRDAPSDEQERANDGTDRDEVGVPSVVAGHSAEEYGRRCEEGDEVLLLRNRGKAVGNDPEESTQAEEVRNAAPGGCVNGASVFLIAEPIVPPLSTPQTAEADTLPVAPVPEGGVGAGTHSEEGGAPNPVRDGGAPAETSADGPVVATINEPYEEIVQLESCGGGDARPLSAGPTSGESRLSARSDVAEPVSEVAPGPQDLDLTIPPFLRRAPVPA